MNEPDRKVLVWYPNYALCYNIEEKKMHKWLINNISGRLEKAYVGCREVGVYLDPEDALIFNLKFGCYGT